MLACFPFCDTPVTSSFVSTTCCWTFNDSIPCLPLFCLQLRCLLWQWRVISIWLWASSRCMDSRCHTSSLASKCKEIVLIVCGNDWGIHFPGRAIRPCTMVARPNGSGCVPHWDKQVKKIKTAVTQAIPGSRCRRSLSAGSCQINWYAAPSDVQAPSAVHQGRRSLATNNTQTPRERKVQASCPACCQCGGVRSTEENQAAFPVH